MGTRTMSRCQLSAGCYFHGVSTSTGSVSKFAVTEGTISWDIFDIPAKLGGRAVALTHACQAIFNNRVLDMVIQEVLA